MEVLLLEAIAYIDRKYHPRHNSTLKHLYDNIQVAPTCRDKQRQRHTKQLTLRIRVYYYHPSMMYLHQIVFEVHRLDPIS